MYESQTSKDMRRTFTPAVQELSQLWLWSSSPLGRWRPHFLLSLCGASVSFGATRIYNCSISLVVLCFRTDIVTN